MATKPLLLCFAIWTGLSAHAGAAASTLPSEISGLVPSCALDCLQSFVSSNYGASGCGTSPSMACLCQKTGTSGFTIGEGAVQCLVAESNRGSCQGNDASQQTISKVYAMCSGVQSAAPETHATIVATLVVPSGTGPVQVLTGSSTTIAFASTSTLASLSNTGTITQLVTMSTATPPTSTETYPASSPSSSVPAGSGGGSRNSGPALNTGQIAGISVGIAATLAFAIGLIFLARCVRRRNIGDQESAIFRPKRESKGFGMLKSSQNSPHTIQISAPIHRTPVEMEFKRPGDFRGPVATKPEAIGLALSQPYNGTATVQDSRLQSPMGLRQPPKTYIPYRPGGQALPKPTLALAIPQTSEEPYKDARTRQSSRDSVVTEFQEDGEAESARGSNIWRPPPSDPQSTTTYYVADQWGNWVLRDRDGDSLPSAMDGRDSQPAMDAASGYSAGRTMPDPGAEMLPGASSVPQTVSADRLGPPIHFTSPVTYATSGAPGMNGPNLSKRRNSRSGARQNRRRSQDLTTPTTTTSVTVANGHDGRRASQYDAQDGLSPVAESPRTPLRSRTSPGTATTTQPQSTARATPTLHRQPGQKQLPTPPKALQPALTLFPRPDRGDQLVNPPPFLVSGQPSPTLGVADVSPLQVQRNRPAAQLSSPAKQPSARAPGLNPHPLRNPAEFKTGSPEMRSGSAPPESERQRRPSPLQQRQPYQQHHHRRGSSLQLQQEQQQRLQYQQSTQQPDLYPRRDPGNNNPGTWASHEQLGPSRPPDRILISPASAATSGSVDSTGSSFLLTKRLGADRAAALTLGEEVGGHSARRVKWQRDEGGPGFTGQDTAAGLPATPGWLPKLTPTRRGDDLFLNVQ